MNNNFTLPEPIEFEYLKDTSEDSFFNKIFQNQSSSCFLVYLRYKYECETEWTYATECCEICNLCDVIWFNDWNEGQQCIEYIGIACVE